MQFLKCWIDLDPWSNFSFRKKTCRAKAYNLGFKILNPVMATKSLKCCMSSREQRVVNNRLFTQSNQGHTCVWHHHSHLFTVQHTLSLVWSFKPLEQFRASKLPTGSLVSRKTINLYSGSAMQLLLDSCTRTVCSKGAVKLSFLKA